MTPVEEEIKVTFIKGTGHWHCRLHVNGKLFAECEVERKDDIGWGCRELLRWKDKMGSDTDRTTAARRRQGNPERGLMRKGRFWWTWGWSL